MAMTDSTEHVDTKVAGLPGAGGLSPGAAAFAGDGPGSDRNAVFGALVQGDGDIVGLVAYSIYKQNKHDWLIAFNKARGREPEEAEQASYIIGESTPRRLATYRHLAEATLEGRGPTTPAGSGAEGFTQRNYAIAARHAPLAGNTGPRGNWGLIGLAGLALIAAIGVYLAARLGYIPGPK